MTRCLLHILLLLLLCQTCVNNVDKPVVEPFPIAEDSWGRTVFYNPTEGKCEDMEGIYVECPRELEVIVDRPK